MNKNFDEIKEIFEYILEGDLQPNIRLELESVFSDLGKGELNQKDLMKIQDSLEVIQSDSRLDDFTRNELMNLIALIETEYNS